MTERSAIETAPQGAAVAGADRATFAINRFLEHVLHVRRDDRALQGRMLERLSRLRPGRRLEIERVEGLDRETFLRDHHRVGRLVILSGLARDWPCVRRWSPAFLAERYGHRTVSVMDNDNTGGAFNVEEMSIARFMELVEAGDTRKYMRFGNLLHQFPELIDDFDEDVLRTYMNRVRLGSNMGAFIGAKGTRTTLHAAPPDNLFAQVYGTKRWILLPASADPVLRPVMARSTYYWTDYDHDAPDGEGYPGTRYLDWYDFELHPGDVLYNPPSWWHQVTNLTTTIGVGFRWMSPMAPRLNLSQFLLFFLATNPPLWVVMRNKRNYPKVLQAAEERTRAIVGG